MSQADEPQAESGVFNRRRTLKLAIAALALGRTLGLPPGLLAAEGAPRMELKYYRNGEGEPELVYAEPLAAPVIDALTGGGDISQIELKWYYSRGLLGSVRMPAEMQLKVNRIKG